MKTAYEQAERGEDKHRFHLAVKWSFVMTWGVAAGSSLSMMVLAAILGPEAYGLVALASVYVLLGQVFVDPGISQALIQRKEVTDDHLDTSFIFVSVLGVTLFCFFAVFYVLFARNWNSELFDVLFWLSLRIPIHALTVVQIAILRRQMNLRALAIRGNISVVSGAAVGIALAVLGFGCWSLVGQQLVEAIVGLALLWGLSDWRPRLKWNTTALRDISGFSVATFMAQIGVFAYMRGDAAVMGFFFSPLAVGIYRLAQRSVSVARDFGTQAVNFAALPELARNQYDREGLRAATLQSLYFAALATLGLLSLLAATSKELVLLLGPQWQSARDPLLILCIMVAFQVVSSIATSMLQAVGRPIINAQLTWVWGVLSVVSTWVVCLVFANDSPERQIMAVSVIHVAFSFLVHYPVYAYLMTKTCDISALETGKMLAPIVFAALCAFFSAEVFRILFGLNRFSPIVGFPIVGLGALTVFGTILFMLDMKFRYLVTMLAAKLRLRQ